MPISAGCRNWTTPLVMPRIRIGGTEVRTGAGMAGQEHHAMRQTQSSLHDAMQERCLPQQKLHPVGKLLAGLERPSPSPRACIEAGGAIVLGLVWRCH